MRYLVKQFVILLLPVLLIYGNLFMICELLKRNVGVQIWAWYIGVNAVWMAPILLYYAKRERDYMNGMLSQNKFSINWNAKKSAQEYIVLLKNQVPERFEEAHKT